MNLSIHIIVNLHIALEYLIYIYISYYKSRLKNFPKSTILLIHTLLNENTRKYLPYNTFCKNGMAFEQFRLKLFIFAEISLNSNIYCEDIYLDFVSLL